MTLPDGLITGVTARLPDGVPLARVGNGNRPPHEVGVMNKSEAAYAWELNLRLRAGEILAWWFEPLKLRLAKRTWYTVDFLVLHADGTLEVVEIKGHLEDDAAVKFKVAREMFLIFKWTMLRRVRGSFERWEI